MEDMEGKLHEAIPRARAVEAREGPETTVLAHELHVVTYLNGRYIDLFNLL
jgi:hypothetical protein